MPRRWTFLFAWTIAVSLGTYACSSTSDSTVVAGSDSGSEATTSDDESDAGTIDAHPAQCVLPVQTNVVKCDDCLLKNCCMAMVSCFDDPDCDALNTCYNKCTAKFPGKSDAGADCVRACADAHMNVVKKFTDMVECENNRCGVACKG